MKHLDTTSTCTCTLTNCHRVVEVCKMCIVFSLTAASHIQKPVAGLSLPCARARLHRSVCVCVLCIAVSLKTGVHSFNANINNNSSMNNIMCGRYNLSNLVISSFSVDGLNTPCSVMMPVISEAGVTSKAGFQQLMPGAAIRCSPTCVISRSGRTSMMI